MILFATVLSREATSTLPERDFLLPAALLAGLFMIGTRCCESSEAMQSIDWSVLIVIGASLGIGEAIKTSGLADTVAPQMIGRAGGNAWVPLGMVYIHDDGSDRTRHEQCRSGADVPAGISRVRFARRPS